MAKILRRVKRLGKRFDIRARRVRPHGTAGPLDNLAPMTLNGRLMNKPETLVTLTLNELRIKNIPQFSFLGGDYLGGGRMDWLLPEYKIDLEYDGPFHQTSGGRVRDELRNIGVYKMGLRVVKIYEHDLYRLKPRLLEIVGRRG